MGVGKNVRYILLVALVAVLVACAQPAEQQPPQEEKLTLYDVSVDDDPAIGEEDAPITIIAFEDYECGHCKKFTEETLPQLKEKYIDTGKVRFVIRDYPIVKKHKQAFLAAQASHCAGEKGKYWAYHDILFENQPDLSREHLIQYAKVLLLDEEEFATCLDTGKYAEEVRKDMADAAVATVSGTPTFFINGFKLEGAHPLQSFDKVIERMQEE